jgi:hypothetical protein
VKRNKERIKRMKEEENRREGLKGKTQMSMRKQTISGSFRMYNKQGNLDDKGLSVAELILLSVGF